MKKTAIAASFLFFSFTVAIGITITLEDRKREKEQAIIASMAETAIKPEQTPTPTATPTPTPLPNPMIEYYQENLKAELESIEVKAVYMSFEYIGDYFITAYCPEECGYRKYSDGSDNFPKGWITATGTICHREEEWWNPSTCGINTAVNNYGDLFLIDGKIYVAEDTGYITGRWIDLFMPDYETMAAFGSHWTPVYAVEYYETDPWPWHFNIHDWRKPA